MQRTLPIRSRHHGSVRHLSPRNRCSRAPLIPGCARVTATRFSLCSPSFLQRPCLPGKRRRCECSRHRTTQRKHPSGDVIWTKTYFPRANEEVAYDIAVDAGGNVYVTGESFNVYSQFVFWSDFLTIKYDPDGN